MFPSYPPWARGLVRSPEADGAYAHHPDLYSKATPLACPLRAGDHTAASSRTRHGAGGGKKRTMKASVVSSSGREVVKGGIQLDDLALELTNEVVDYLKGIFHMFDIDNDSALLPSELEDLFSTTPEKLLIGMSWVDYHLKDFFLSEGWTSIRTITYSVKRQQSGVFYDNTILSSSAPALTSALYGSPH